MTDALTLEGLTVDYGGVEAVRGVDLTVARGTITALIGANGAGKTTLLRAISGLSPFTGSLKINGEPAADGPHRRAALGVALCPEGRRVFPYMSVADNLLLGAYSRKDRKDIRRDLDQVYDHFPRLLERRKQLAGSLSGGEQQMLAIGRALMSRPDILMLDEPSLGLAPKIVAQIGEKISELHASQGMTVLLVEQNAAMALTLAEHAHVLENGRIALSGLARDLKTEPRVRELYLGG